MQACICSCNPRPALLCCSSFSDGQAVALRGAIAQEASVYSGSNSFIGWSPQAAAVRVAGVLDLAELLLQGVIEQEAAHERFALAQHQLHRLDRLHEPDDPRQDAQHARLLAGGRQLRRRRLGEEAAVAGPVASRHERRGLPVEAEDRPVHVGLLQDDAGVVDQVAGAEVVRPVDDHDVAKIGRISSIHSPLGM
jgi:hypothetical protein